MSKKQVVVVLVILVMMALLGAAVLAATNLASANFTAEIGTASRLYVYPKGSSTHQCRTNGAGDNPSDLLAMYEVGGVPYVLGTYGGGTRLYSGPAGLPGIRQCPSQQLSAPVAPACGGDYAFVAGSFLVEHKTNNRVHFYLNDGKCKNLGRTNGHTDNGALLAAWEAGGVPYALVQRPPTNGRNPLIVITPSNNAGSVKLVNILNP